MFTDLLSPSSDLDRTTNKQDLWHENKKVNLSEISYAHRVTTKRPGIFLKFSSHLKKWYYTFSKHWDGNAKRGYPNLSIAVWSRRLKGKGFKEMYGP